MSASETNPSRQERAQPGAPPKLGGLRLGPRFAIVLYALLLGSAVLAFWGNRVPGAVPEALARLAPWVFLTFLVLFAAYRFSLVRARKYPVFKAFFQIAVAGAVFALLLPGARWKDVPMDGELSPLLENEDPRIRAVTAEVMGHRQEKRYGPALVAKLEDESPEVRRRAHEALVRLTGEDLGAPESKDAVQAWRKRYP